MIKSILSALLLFSVSMAGDLKFDFTGDIGFIPHAASREYKTPIEDLYKAYNKVFNLRLRPQLEYKFIYGLVDVTTFSSAPKTGSFWPFRLTLGNEFGIFYKIDSFRFTLGWEHNCSHRNITTMPSCDNKAHYSDNGYDNIFIRFHYSN